LFCHFFHNFYFSKEPAVICGGEAEVSPPAYLAGLLLHLMFEESAYEREYRRFCGIFTFQKIWQAKSFFDNSTSLPASGGG
jgi:hypothetical protein